MSMMGQNGFGSFRLTHYPVLSITQLEDATCVAPLLETLCGGVVMINCKWY
jgi:hypothetical protein